MNHSIEYHDRTQLEQVLTDDQWKERAKRLQHERDMLHMAIGHLSSLLDDQMANDIKGLRVTGFQGFLCGDCGQPAVFEVKSSQSATGYYHWCGVCDIGG